jgi:hypothetical protein
MLCHLLHLGATLCLQPAADGILQFQHLGSYIVKKWEHCADLLHRILGAEGNEAEGHQCCLGLAQEVIDFLCLTCLGCLELLQPATRGGKLLKLPFYQPLLPFRQSLLPIYQLFLLGV